MTQVTSLPLSKQLWEKGLKIETEKWHNNQGLGHWHIGFYRPDMSEYPAYSTDELLAVMPDTVDLMSGKGEVYISKQENCLGKTLYIIAYSDTKDRRKLLHYFIEEILPEALGLMVKWLLENGYHFNGKELGR